MNLFEEFNRIKITEIKDKLLYDINQINNGIYLKEANIQTDYMNEINIFGKNIQSIRNKNIFTREIKILEAEWKQVFYLVKEYDIAVKRYNSTHKNKIKTFKQRTGGEIFPSIKTCFQY